MADRVTLDGLPKNDQKEEEPKKEEPKKAEPISHPDLRPEVPPGDPEKQTSTVSKTEMHQVGIATPTARVVFRARAVFPFDLFPDELVIDEIKINIVAKNFFATEDVNHVLIKDVKNIEMHAVPFFAQLIIEDQSGNIYKIGFLTKNIAYKAKRLILGLLIMAQRQVDTSKIEIPELIARAEELGAGRK